MPDVVFDMADAAGRVWRVTYNPQKGSLSGVPADTAKPDLSVRRYLTRLHLAHGYRSDSNSRWGWAVVVDAMAIVMVFWAASGLVMWWQLKAARRWGMVVLLLSAATAAVLAAGMYAALRG